MKISTLNRTGRLAVLAVLIPIALLVGPLPTQTADAATGTITVKSTTQRMSGGSLKSRYLGELRTGYRTTAGCKIIGQKVSGVLGTSNVWFDTPVGWIAAVDATSSVNLGDCVTRRAIGAKERSNSAPYGQCTWLAKTRAQQLTGASPALYGNAMNWLASARDAGFTTVLDAPLSGKAIVVFQPGVQGAGSVGHVAWVRSTEQRSTGRWITIEEHNYYGQGAVLHVRTIKDVVGMSYILVA